MNHPRNKLNERQEEEQASLNQQTVQAHQQHQQQQAIEFQSAEEMLRHDRAGTTVPGAVAERLNRSLENLPRPARPWWRFWGG